jgi:shikimate dehydrogenase
VSDGGPPGTSRSVLLGLIGSSIRASRSPALHEQEAAAHGLKCIYKVIDLEMLRLGAEALGELVTAAERLGFTGLNITHPCKQTVISLLDELSPKAEALGAVNTVVFQAGRRVGHNTDWFGFAESYRRGMGGVPFQRVVQIGAGGAGAAVAEAMLTLGTQELVVIDLDERRAGELATQLNRRHGAGRVAVRSDAAEALARADGVINASPVGMTKYPGTPVNVALLRPEMWVADVVYIPLETELLRAARARGCRTLAGGGMAVFQAAEAFRLFTGIAPDTERMQRHFMTLWGTQGMGPERVR